MESHSKPTITPDATKDEQTQMPMQLLTNDDVQPSTSVRPTTLPQTTTESVHTRYSNVAHIQLTPSPIDNRPRLFRSGTLFDSNTFERIQSTVYTRQEDTKKINDEMKQVEEDDDDDNDNNNDGKNLDDIIRNARAQEIERLSQAMIKNRPIHDNEVANDLLYLLNNPTEHKTVSLVSLNDDNIGYQTTTTTMLDNHPYPPINQTGPIADHDVPYADYGHL
ncbi:unnamed protein product, partial [Rotaria sp. Silwood1]